jgi:hypothetical protein
MMPAPVAPNGSTSSVPLSQLCLMVSNCGKSKGLWEQPGVVDQRVAACQGGDDSTEFICLHDLIAVLRFWLRKMNGIDSMVERVQCEGWVYMLPFPLQGSLHADLTKASL